ncbi:MAG TPA: HEAT repeat domain-containing protein [Bryobacteraceae bacterium]|nr:HEAT repeat domain-containing protein [Bryobacteraceae bacterium]
MTRAALLVSIATAAMAQQPAIENAKVETRAFSGSLATQLAQFGAGPFWAGYSEPAMPRAIGDMCCGDNGCRGYAAGAAVRLEGDTSVVILARMEGGRVDKLRVMSPDCRLDGGNLPFYWINSVPADASVAWLKSQTASGQPDPAIFAIAMHSAAAADQALNDLSAPAQPEKVREKTAFWLGTSRGAKGLETLKRMLANDPSDQVRSQVIFAMAQNKDPQGMKTVIDAARSDRSPHVRQQALFWLAQKAGDKQAADVIHNAALNDTDRAVKEHAVFALTQLPHDQGIPMLIDLAKTNSDPAVRKRALFWLGQSGDPRALDFIAQILKQ